MDEGPPYFKEPDSPQQSLPAERFTYGRYKAFPAMNRMAIDVLYRLRWARTSCGPEPTCVLTTEPPFPSYRGELIPHPQPSLAKSPRDPSPIVETVTLSRPFLNYA